jgi:hypothetical protein
LQIVKDALRGISLEMTSDVTESERLGADIDAQSTCWCDRRGRREMAKKSGMAKRRAGGASSRKRVATSQKGAKAASAFAHEDHIDGCDFEFDEREATHDADLPIARGGVEMSRRKGRRAAHQRM